MTTSSGPPVLSTGAVVDSDAESTAWKKAINALGKDVISRRDGVESPLRLNVVFHVDSKAAPNEFEGVRTGRFSKKDAHLMVQAAVPMSPSDDRRRVLLGLMRAAVDEAEAFARKQGIAENLDDIRRLVERVPAD